jgi:hypothetical protein
MERNPRIIGPFPRTQSRHRRLRTRRTTHFLTVLLIVGSLAGSGWGFFNFVGRGTESATSVPPAPSRPAAAAAHPVVSMGGPATPFKSATQPRTISAMDQYGGPRKSHITQTTTSLKPRPLVIPLRARSAVRSQEAPAVGHPPQTQKPAPVIARAKDSVATQSRPSSRRRQSLADPPVNRNQGWVDAVDCQRLSFVMHGPAGVQRVYVTQATSVYVNVERVSGSCALRPYVGSWVKTWTTVVGSRRIAGRIDVMGGTVTASASNR